MLVSTKNITCGQQFNETFKRCKAGSYPLGPTSSLAVNNLFFQWAQRPQIQVNYSKALYNLILLKKKIKSSTGKGKVTHDEQRTRFSMSAKPVWNIQRTRKMFWWWKRRSNQSKSLRHDSLTERERGRGEGKDRKWTERRGRWDRHSLSARDKDAKSGRCFPMMASVSPS